MINEKRSNGVFSLIQIDVENIDHTFSRFNRIYRVVMQRWMRFIWNSIGWNTAPHAKFSSFFLYQKNTIASWLIRITREKVLAERQWLTNASSENKNTVVLFAIAFTIQSHVRLGFFFGLLAQFMSESNKPQFLYMNWHNTQQIFCFFNFNVFIFVPAVHICVPLLLLLSNSRHVSLPANIRFILFGLCVSRPRPLVSFA